jgi:putative inorganic carbon (HCO3(-)) transporter
MAMLVLCLLKEKNKGIAAYMVLMITAFVAINSTAHVNRIDLSVVNKDSSSLYRIEIWKAAINMFMENPISGHGPGTTWYYLSSGSDKLYKYILHSHNIYLQVAAEMGILGVFAFIYLLISKINDGIRLLKEKTSEEEACLLQGFIACTAGIAIHGLIDAVIFVPALSLIFMSYSAMYGRVISEHSMARSLSMRMHYRWKPGIIQLFESKGVLKLFSCKSTGKDEYKEEESKACQA